MCVLHHQPYFNSICHDNMLAQKTTEKERQTKQLRQWRQRKNKITMFRCGEVKWTSETEQSERLSSPLTRPPSLATVQLNLVKIFPYPMPSRETEQEGGGGGGWRVQAVSVWGLRRNGRRRIKGSCSSKGLQKPAVLRLKAVTSKWKQSRRERHCFFMEGELVPQWLNYCRPWCKHSSFVCRVQSSSLLLGLNLSLCTSGVSLWLVWVCLSALYTSSALIKSQLTGCYPRSPEQVAETARRNLAQIQTHICMTAAQEQSLFG